MATNRKLKTLELLQLSSTKQKLNIFKSSLERIFIGNAVVSSRYSSDDHEINLIININCNFNLSECLHHYNNGSWGGVLTESKETRFGLKQLMDSLNDIEGIVFDICEFSLHFEKIQLLLIRVADQTIYESFDSIMYSLSENFLFYTFGSKNIPFEIFIPVQELNEKKNPNELLSIDNTYNSFWGVYLKVASKCTSMTYKRNHYSEMKIIHSTSLQTEV